MAVAAPSLTLGLGGPNSIAAGDLDGDGHVDIVTTHPAGSLTVALGKGDGTFGPTQLASEGLKWPCSMEVAEVTGDGVPDVVLTERDADVVSVFHGKGGGDFTKKDSYPTGMSPVAVGLGQLGGSGLPDLAVVNLFGDSVSVLRHQAGATYAPATSYPGAHLPGDLVLSDLNGDGLTDLVVVGSDPSNGSVAVLTGTSPGSFATLQSYSSGKQTYALAVGDLNEDGAQDVVAANFADDSLSIFFGETGAPGKLGCAHTFPTGSGPTDVLVRDVDGDGHADLLIVHNVGSTAWLLIGRGDGTFQSPLVLPTGAGSLQGRLADVNGDGQLDVLVGNFGSSDVSVTLLHKL